ncbi:hypothetical protein H4S14_001013 [Agrobacterium vitis]|nr:hypothetical protein [Agrobacterium vitis]MBE1437282.1 hypothetical protein [Agrobacterium vitis]
MTVAVLSVFSPAGRRWRQPDEGVRSPEIRASWTLEKVEPGFSEKTNEKYRHRRDVSWRYVCLFHTVLSVDYSHSIVPGGFDVTS